MNFTPASFSFNDPDELLDVAARLTMRLALIHPGDDEEAWNSLYSRITDLMGAYANSTEGEGVAPGWLMGRFANAVAVLVREVPSVRAALAADLASKPDEDP
jgi:hypothetical protein